MNYEQELNCALKDIDRITQQRNAALEEAKWLRTALRLVVNAWYAEPYDSPKFHAAMRAALEMIQ